MFFLSRFKASTMLLLFIGISSQAASFTKDGFLITVAPIIGYELTQEKTPSPHTRAMIIYGARATAGRKFLAAEAEYTTGNTFETFVLQDENITTTKQNARLGLRSLIPFAHYFDFLFRAGGQASKIKTDTTTISTASTVTSTPSMEIHPYAGTGIEGSFSDMFSLSLEATYLFRSVSDWSQNDVQGSLSFKIHLLSK